MRFAGLQASKRQHYGASVKKKIVIDPTQPLRCEVVFYMSDDQELAIWLYVARMRVSRLTAEDTIRKHLTELGFKTLPPIYLPREN